MQPAIRRCGCSLTPRNSEDTKDYRILQENESYYKMYDDPKYKDNDVIDEDEWDWDSLYDEEE